MTYQVAVSLQGSPVELFDGIEAQSSLEAIDRIEQKYKAHPVQLSEKNGNARLFQWTGYEFQARSLGMTLS